MAGDYFHQIVFDKDTHFSQDSLKANEYEDCRFEHCDMDKADVSQTAFSECTFTDCNLSMARLTKTAFRNVRFQNCKLLGLHFEDANPFGFSVQFEGCILDHSSFYGMNIRETSFVNTSLREVDFTDADISGSAFDKCDLLNAHFENTHLENADFRTAVHFQINPTINKIRKARFSMDNLEGLLISFDISVE